MADWHPIDTAPDDVAVLVFKRDGRIPQMATAMRSRGQWWAFGSLPITPTHWMPLPDPPAARPEEPPFTGDTHE